MNKKIEGTINKIKRSRSIAIGFISIFTVLVITTGCASDTALPESRNLFTLYDNYNMTVVVVFDEEPPEIVFIAPDGNPVDMNTIRYRPGSNFTQYFLPNSMPGTWRMVYDPLSNTEISTPYSVYMEHIFIRNFEAHPAEIEHSVLPVSFEVSSDESGEFRYEIHTVFIAPDNSVEAEVLLIDGYGTLNENLNVNISGDISKQDGFMLRLTAYVQHGQAAIADTAWLDLRLGG